MYRIIIIFCIAKRAVIICLSLQRIYRVSPFLLCEYIFVTHLWFRVARKNPQIKVYKLRWKHGPLKDYSMLLSAIRLQFRQQKWWKWKYFRSTHTKKKYPKFWTIYCDSEIEKEVGLQKLPKNHNIPPSIKEEWGTLDRAGTSILGCYKSCPERTFKSLGMHANLSSYWILKW